MRMIEATPVLYHLYRYHYRVGEQEHGRISYEKTQYVYRVLYLAFGSLSVRYQEREEPLRPGDALYLVPGEYYRLMPQGEDFSLYAISFDYTAGRMSPGGRTHACVFRSEYDAALCSSRVSFEDAPTLNTSGVFRGLFCERQLEAMLGAERTGALYGFLGRATLLSVIAGMLSAWGRGEGGGTVTKEILAYLHKNPTGDLSGDALSQRFSYHKNHINKLVRQATGKSLGAYVRAVKIDYAKALLTEGTHTPAELAGILGYYDYSHFYKAFVAETGCSPLGYVHPR